jgi:hypothetical protein
MEKLIRMIKQPPIKTGVISEGRVWGMSVTD